VKVASFHVGATQEQAIRWKRAANADGHRAVGTWLAVVADAHLKARARDGRPVALAWHYGSVRVVLDDGTTVQVRAMVSPPFATYRGNSEGPNGKRYRTLVYAPTGKVIATLRNAAQAKLLAAELAPVLLRENQELVTGIVERHERESK
jgi:hypothetical protein